MILQTTKETSCTIVYSDLCTKQPVAIVTPIHGYGVRESGQHVVEDKERGLEVSAV